MWKIDSYCGYDHESEQVVKESLFHSGSQQENRILHHHLFSWLVGKYLQERLRSKTIHLLQHTNRVTRVL